MSHEHWRPPQQTEAQTDHPHHEDDGRSVSKGPVGDYIPLGTNDSPVPTWLAATPVASQAPHRPTTAVLRIAPA